MILRSLSPKMSSTCTQNPILLREAELPLGKQEAACFPGVGGRCNDGNVASLRLTDPEINGLPHGAAVVGRRRRPGSLASSGLDWPWKELSYANASSFRLLGCTAVTLSERKV